MQKSPAKYDRSELVGAWFGDGQRGRRARALVKAKIRRAEKKQERREKY